MSHRGESPLGSDHGCLIIIEVQPSLPGTGLFHLHLHNALASSVARAEFGVDLFDTRILPEQLQPFLQRFQAQRLLRAPLDAVAQVTGTEPALSLHIDFSQGPFDDLNGDDAQHHVLIGNDRAGRDVTPIHV